MSRATLTPLDTSLYPQVCKQQAFDNASDLLLALLNSSLTLDPNDFTKQLMANNVYQEWINATVFGRYIQRSFTAFYRQTEDSFNMDMPALFRHELLRHAQFLPLEQILFVAGEMPKSARQEKLFTTTINPATAVMTAQKLNQKAVKSGRASTQQLIINQIKIAGKQVIGFPIRHNKRTSERTRNEVLIMDFKDLRLVNEEIVEKSSIIKSGMESISMDKSNSERSKVAQTTLLRYYELR